MLPLAGAGSRSETESGRCGTAKAPVECAISPSKKGPNIHRPLFDYDIFTFDSGSIGDITPLIGNRTRDE